VEFSDYALLQWYANAGSQHAKAEGIFCNSLQFHLSHLVGISSATHNKINNVFPAFAPMGKITFRKLNGIRRILLRE